MHRFFIQFNELRSYGSYVVVCDVCVRVRPNMTGDDQLSWGSADGKHQLVVSARQPPS